MNILLVDDSRTMRNIEKKVLSGQWPDATFWECGDGVEAMMLLGGAKPPVFDLILIDSNMPGMDGLSLVGRIRQRDRVTPLMMVITEAQEARVVEAIKAGVNNYIVKPFAPAVLLEKVMQTRQRCARQWSAAA